VTTADVADVAGGSRTERHASWAELFFALVVLAHLWFERRLPPVDSTLRR
jgi:hypothetical protein